MKALGSKYFLGLILSLVLILVISPLVSSINSTNVYGCGNLNITGMTYILQNNLLGPIDKNCITIGADNITFDLNGRLIIGKGKQTGIFAYYSNNNFIVRNGTILNFQEGIFLGYSNNSLIEDMQFQGGGKGIKLRDSNFITVRNSIFNNNGDGIFLNGGHGNYFKNLRISNSGGYGIWMGGSINNTFSNIMLENNRNTDVKLDKNPWDSKDCNQIFENITGTGNKPILFINDSSDLSNMVLSELILCNANGSVIKNIKINSGNAKNNGLFIQRSNNLLLSKLDVSNTGWGIIIEYSNNVNISESRSRFNSGNGWITSGKGIAILISKNIHISNNNLEGNEDGIYFLGENYNHTINGNIIGNNNYAGIKFSHWCSKCSEGTEISGNYILNNGQLGIEMSTFDNYNFIYNNYFNNSLNFWGEKPQFPNGWNTTKTKGKNILDGNFIGGNFWAQPDRGGYSQTCLDINKDKFCDLPYNLVNGETDFLPYVDFSRDKYKPKLYELVVVNASQGSETDAGFDYLVKGNMTGIFSWDDFTTNKTLTFRGTFTDSCFDNITLVEGIFGGSIAPSLSGLAGVALVNCSDPSYPGSHCFDGRCVLPPRPFSIKILNPPKHSTIYSRSTNLIVTTTENAICKYGGKLIPQNLMSSFNGSLITLDKKRHTQKLNNLLNGVIYNLTFNCTETFGNSKTSNLIFYVDLAPKDYTRLTTGVGQYVGQKLNSKSILTQGSLPVLLSDRQYYDAGTGNFKMTSALMIGPREIQNSTSGGNLPSPRMLLEVGTNPNNYLYEYRILFSKQINVSSMSEPNANSLELLGKFYKIQNGSTSSKIIFRGWITGNIISLESGKPAKVNNQVINGTMVGISATTGKVSMISIKMAMQDPNKDYIAVGEVYTNPIFSNLKTDFSINLTTNVKILYAGGTSRN